MGDDPATNPLAEMSAEDMARELTRRGEGFVLAIRTEDATGEGVEVYRAGGAFVALGLLDRSRRIIHRDWDGESDDIKRGWPSGEPRVD